MVNTMRLMEISRRWQKGRTVSPACPRGHFAAYTRDGQRFFIPVAYLASNIFRELLNMAEEEFGVPGDRPIILPCNADCMEQILATFRSAKKGSSSEIR